MPQQNAIKSADMINTLTASLLFIFFINSIPHPSNRFYVVNSSQLFSQIFDVRVNNPFIPEKLIFPERLQKILPC